MDPTINSKNIDFPIGDFSTLKGSSLQDSAAKSIQTLVRDYSSRRLERFKSTTSGARTLSNYTIEKEKRLKEEDIDDLKEFGVSRLPARLFPNLRFRLKNTPFQGLHITKKGEYVIASIATLSRERTEEKRQLEDELVRLKPKMNSFSVERTKEIESRLLDIERIEITKITASKFWSKIDEMEKEEEGSSKNIYNSAPVIEKGLYPETLTLYNRFTKDLPKIYLKDLIDISEEYRDPPFLAMEKYQDLDSSEEKIRTVIVIDKMPPKDGDLSYVVIRNSEDGSIDTEVLRSFKLKKYTKKLFKGGPSRAEFTKSINGDPKIKEALDFLKRKQRDYNDIKNHLKENARILENPTPCVSSSRFSNESKGPHFEGGGGSGGGGGGWGE